MSDDMKQPYSILFIDDERETRDNYVNYLRRYHEIVYIASDGVEGYSVYLDKKPQILILDINMPRMNGLTLLEKIREKDKKTRCIMLTAYTDRDFLLRATRLNLTDYLIKPLKRGDLREALVKVIDDLDRYEVIEKSTLGLGDGYRWDAKKSRLLLDDTEIVLTGLEKKLLGFLLANINMDLSFDTLIISLWDSFDNDRKDSLKTLIKKLRKKLPKDMIQNIYGVGYRVVL